MFDIILTTGLVVAVLALVWCATETLINGLVAMLARLFPCTFR